MTVIEVDEFDLRRVAWTLPKATVTGATKPVPVIVTNVPPAAGPFLAESFLTVGSDAGFRREFASAPVAVPVTLVAEILKW